MFFVLIQYVDDNEKSWEVYKPNKPPFKTKKEANTFAKKAATEDGPNKYFVVKATSIFEQEARPVSVTEIDL